MDTIKAAILADLKAGHRLTQLTCLIRFKTMAGTQRINELRRTTHPEIQQRMIKLDSGKRVAEYWI
jgi:hypothetical protein